MRISFDEVDTVKDPPSREFLEKNVDEDHPDEYFNNHSKPCRELGLAGKSFGKPELIDLMSSDPDLVKCPILVHGKRVHFGYKKI